MRIDKLTTKFQEALGEAQTLALANDHAYIEPAHVLVAMLRQDDGPKALLQRAGVNVNGLLAAGETLGNDSFRYTRVFDCGDRAVLEFETEMDGIAVNGVDMIAWNGDGQITDFKVMVRPLKAINAVHAAMGAMLAKMKAGA